MSGGKRGVCQGVLLEGCCKGGRAGRGGRGEFARVSCWRGVVRGTRGGGCKEQQKRGSQHAVFGSLLVCTGTWREARSPCKTRALLGDGGALMRGGGGDARCAAMERSQNHGIRRKRSPSPRAPQIGIDYKGLSFRPSTGQNPTEGKNGCGRPGKKEMTDAHASLGGGRCELLRAPQGVSYCQATQTPKAPCW